MLLFAAACADTGNADNQEPDESEELSEASAAITSGYTLCAFENQHCTFSGKRQVTFGAFGTTVTKTFTDGVDCTAANFGTVNSRVKVCAYGPLLTTTAPTTGTTAPTTGTTAPTTGTTAPTTGTTAPTTGTTAPTTGTTAPTTGTTAPTTGTTAPTTGTTTPTTGTTTPTTGTTTPTTGTTTPTTGTTAPTVTLPPQLCTSPLAQADVSHPTTVVGTGTAASCTEGALRTALSNGGVVTFNCGSAATTIKVTQTLIVPSTKDTTLDGNNLITLDGGNGVQIMSVSGTDFRANDHVLTVQRLSMVNGKFAGTTFVPRDGSKTCAWGYKGTGGGGAIFANDMNVHVWGVTFDNNHGPDIGPDVGGGAIRMTGSKNLVVANSTFRNNSASNGGAIGVLHTATALYNSIFENNSATGILANFANDTGCGTFDHDQQGGAGGLGGAFYSDGFDPGDTFCGVRMSSNSSGDLGGAVFRSAYWGLISTVGKQTISWTNSTFENNKSATGGGGAAYVNNSYFVLKNVTFTGNDAGSSDGGGIKLTGITVSADTVTFTSNKATAAGGVAHWSGGVEGNGTATNIKYSGNAPNNAAGVGVFPQ